MLTERSDSSHAGSRAGQSGDRPGAHQERSQRQPGRRGERIKHTHMFLYSGVLSPKLTCSQIQFTYIYYFYIVYLNLFIHDLLFILFIYLISLKTFNLFSVEFYLKYKQIHC